MIVPISIRPRWWVILIISINLTRLLTRLPLLNWRVSLSGGDNHGYHTVGGIQYTVQDNPEMLDIPVLDISGSYLANSHGLSNYPA